LLGFWNRSDWGSATHSVLSNYVRLTGEAI